MMWRLYLIARLDGRGYVGLTKQTVKRRVQQHIKNDRAGIGAAMRTEGTAKFVWCEIDTAKTLSEAKRLERVHIGLLHTMEPNGWNRTRGGNGHTPSKRLRKRISKAPRREQPFYPIDDLDFQKARQDWFDAMSIQEEVC